MSVVRSPRVALGVTALAGLTALGGMGVAMSNDGAALNGASRMNITGVATTTTKPKTSVTTPSTPTEPTSPSTNPPSSGEAQLYSLLPAGFDKSNCKTSPDEPAPGSTADLVCGANSLGPARGEFVLYSAPGAMNQTFQDWANEEDTRAPCPGFHDTPADWFYDSSDAPSGKIACGNFNGTADLIWTENDTLMLGNISGGTIEALAAYWKSPGGSTPAGKNRS
jgi:serine/threonine-protein kinase